MNLPATAGEQLRPPLCHPGLKNKVSLKNKVGLPGKEGTSMRIIGYTYEAEMHCVRCAIERFSPGSKHYDFGQGLSGTDREGNEIHPIFDIDEGSEDEYCGDCRVNLMED